VCTRPLVSEEQLDVVISDAVKAQKSWKRVSIDERIQIAEKWMVSEA
jgi:acyl-CoA reductase-like NAD-dependent aldehyde dehydrogenase